MNILFYTLISVYFLAINLYSIIIMSAQKRVFEEGEDIHDGKIILSAFLGGAISIYAFMLIKKYRLSNLFLMVITPVLSVICGFLLYYAFTIKF